MSYQIGVDIGGTFADFCALDEATGRLATLKVLSTPAEPGREVIAGLAELESRFGIQPQDIGYFTHGTTVGINSVIQRKGIRLCLFTTENFVDVLELARLKMPDPYHLMSRRAEPLITRDRVLPVRQRILADGTVETPLDPASLRDALDQAIALGAEGIVLAFLHSYRNPAHEREAARLIAQWAPEMPVFCSSEVWPIIREYERTATATIHGYVQPPVARYLTALQAALQQAGVAAPAMVTKSNGGVMTAELGKSACLQMLLSGTAAGVIGAGFVARQAGHGQGAQPRHRRHLRRRRHHRRRHADLRHGRNGRRLSDLHPDRLGDLDRRRRRLDRRGQRIRHPDGRARKRRFDARSGLLWPWRHAAHHDRCFRRLWRDRPRQHRL